MSMFLSFLITTTRIKPPATFPPLYAKATALQLHQAKAYFSLQNEDTSYTRYQKAVSFLRREKNPVCLLTVFHLIRQAAFEELDFTAWLGPDLKTKEDEEGGGRCSITLFS